MSDFRVILLTALLILAVYKLLTRRRRPARETSGDECSATETCPDCDAEIEPGFLECWNCRKKFATKKKPSENAKES